MRIEWRMVARGEEASELQVMEVEACCGEFGSYWGECKREG